MKNKSKAERLRNKDKTIISKEIERKYKSIFDKYEEFSVELTNKLRAELKNNQALLATLADDGV